MFWLNFGLLLLLLPGIRFVHEVHNKKASKHGMTIKGKYIHQNTMQKKYAV